MRRVIEVNHLDPVFLMRLDEEYGKIVAENGGYVTFLVRMEGRPEPRYWQKEVRYLGTDSDKKG